jgi:hypothetical protein
MICTILRINIDWLQDPKLTTLPIFAACFPGHHVIFTSVLVVAPTQRFKMETLGKEKSQSSASVADTNL